MTAISTRNTNINPLPKTEPQVLVQQSELQSAKVPGENSKGQAVSGDAYATKETSNKFATGEVKNDSFGYSEGEVRDAFVHGFVGTAVSEQLKRLNDEEKGVRFCFSFADELVNNPDIDPETKKAAVVEIADEFGKYVSPNNPQIAMSINDAMVERMMPDDLKNP